MIETWSPSRPVTRLSFISDLHLFSSRSNAIKREGLIRDAIEAADLCVWGGDLFDFRWSRLPSEQETVTRSLDWLQRWYDEFPRTQFVFLDGNHDAHQMFAEQLARWADRRDRFRCGLDCLRINDTLLLHGDVIEGKASPDGFAGYRHRWKSKRVAGDMASGIYDMAVAAGVHRVAAMAAHRRRATCARLLRWLDHQPHDRTRGLRRIVFGHTHRRIRGYHYRGFDFFNGGAAIVHVPFSPVILEMNEPAAATEDQKQEPPRGLLGFSKPDR
ncbi:MAG: metallophosphoesterase [Pirellulales bacterium]|nr:metallophosphoesterase [Pirellulales bacterium]